MSDATIAPMRCLTLLLLVACNTSNDPVLRFSWLATTLDCNGVCDITHPLMVGATARMRARGAIEESDLRVETEDEDVALFTYESEMHECVRTEKGPDGQDVEMANGVTPNASCGRDAPRATVFFTAEGKSAGATRVYVLRQDARIDWLTIAIEEPTAVEAPANFSVAVGVTGEIGVTVRGNQATLIPGDEGVTVTSSNDSIVSASRVSGKQTSFEVHGRSAGAASLTFRARGVETTVAVSVP